MRGLRKLARCAAACVPAVGLVIAFGPAAGAAPAAPAKVPSAAVAKAARTALQQYLNHHHGILQRGSGHVNVPAVAGVTAASQSTNWSGYSDSGTGFTTVAGTWTEPTVTCNGWNFSLVGLWVGIDGDGSNSVEQDGTMTECLFGLAFHFSWWEMYPTNSVQVVGYTVSAGDHITASVVRSGTSYALKVTDSTHTSDSFSTTQTCSTCANSSAEWIAEAPSTLFGVSSLASFGTWSLTAATAATASQAGTISSFSDNAITMVSSSGDTEAVPSALNASGSAFTDAWKASS